jgi:hypothetical protein
MLLMLPPASHCTRISFTSATRILLREHIGGTLCRDRP